MKIPQFTRGLSLGLALFTLFLGNTAWAGCESGGIWFPNPDGVGGWCQYPEGTVSYGTARPNQETPEERAAAQRRAEAAEYQRWLKQERKIIGKDSWGVVALAVKTNKGDDITGSSVATGERSRAKAEEKALAACKKNGGLDCRLLATFKNTCVATVNTGLRHDGAQPAAIARAGATKREAYNNAMRACQALYEWENPDRIGKCELWGNVACSGWGWNDSNNHTPDLDQARLTVPPELADIPLPPPDVDYEGYPNASPRGLAISTNGAVTQ